jgi:N4-gp56 family major capsid protein
MAVVTSSNNSSLSPLNVFYDRVPLKRLIAKTVYYQLAWKKSLEDNKGRTYSWTIGGVQSADNTPLAEGVPVVPTNVSSSTITTQVQEYGNAMAISSLLGNTSVVDADKFLLEQIEQKGAYTIDQLIRDEVFNTCTTFGTNLFAANNKASIAAIGAADTLSNADLRRLHFVLENNNTPEYKNGYMAAIISVGQKYDVTNSATGGAFLDLVKESPFVAEYKKSMEIMEDGEVSPIGSYSGLVLFSTTLAPVVGNGTTNVHYAAAWGSESLAATELSGERFKLFRKEADKDSSMYDILGMIKLALGYKMAFAAKNLSQDLTTPSNQRVIVMGSAVSLF